MKTHYLKTLPEYFKAVKDRTKNFELRINDRDFKVGDMLYLEEWSRDTSEYTGRRLVRKIEYILEGDSFGLRLGYAIMSIK